MRSPEQKISWRNLNLPVDSVIFFVCFYLYVLLFIKPRLIYHGFGTFIAYPAFSVDWGFLKSSLSYPGGVVEYTKGFLSQLYYFSWLGALVVTAVAFLLYLAARILVRLLAGQTLKIICYIPAIMLLMIHNRYDSQLTTFLSLLVVLLFSVAYEKMTVRSSAARAAVFLIMFALLYYIAVNVSFVFAFLVTIYEIFVGRRRALKILFPAVAIGNYLVARYIFDLQTETISLQLLLARLSYDPWVKNTVICTYFFFPLALFVVGLWQVRKKASVGKSKMRAKHKSSIARKSWQLFQNNKGKWALVLRSEGASLLRRAAIQTALPVVILVVSIFVSFDGTKKKLIQIDYFAHQRMWPEVLQTARQIRPKSYDVCCIHDVDRALYYTGRLGDEMFCYPQKLPALILTSIEAKRPPGRIFMKRIPLLLELGHIADAERSAFEYMEIEGSSPLVLEQLATIKLVKGQVEAAKVFLRALSKDLIFGNRGREMLQRLEQDPKLADDKTIQHIRSVASEKEDVHLTLDIGDFFHQLLDKNKNNKMAFEYMMAFYLLTGQVEKVVANIGRLSDFGYERLPQYYEEAIVIYMATRKKSDLPLSGWLPRRETIERAKTVGGTYNFYGGKYNEQHIRKALGPDFANSYFLYYLFDAPRAIK